MDIIAHPSLELNVIVVTIFYALLGIFLMIVSTVAFDKLFKLDLHKELVEDENIAFGVLFAGVAIAIAIIIAASIIG